MMPSDIPHLGYGGRTYNFTAFYTLNSGYEPLEPSMQLANSRPIISFKSLHSLIISIVTVYLKQ